jgi:DNA end-binding protein Ku
MAASLIDTMTEDFDPSAYTDAYREALEALVQAKIEGNEVIRPAGGFVADKPAGPADLTETLRASVEAAKANRSRDKEAARPAPAKDKPAGPKRPRTPAAQAKEDTPAKPASSRRKASA